MTENVYKYPSFFGRKFLEIWPNEDVFIYDWSKFLGNRADVGPENIKWCYFLLVSKYGEAISRYANELIFKMNILKEAECRFPMYLAKDRDQLKLRDTDLKDFMKSGTFVTNVGQSNTQSKTDAEIGDIRLDSQTANVTENGELEVLTERYRAYRAGLEDEFLKHFRNYFVQILARQQDLIYLTINDLGENHE